MMSTRNRTLLAVGVLLGAVLACNTPSPDLPQFFGETTGSLIEICATEPGGDLQIAEAAEMPMLLEVSGGYKVTPFGTTNAQALATGMFTLKNFCQIPTPLVFTDAMADIGPLLEAGDEAGAEERIDELLGSLTALGSMKLADATTRLQTGPDRGTVRGLLDLADFYDSFGQDGSRFRDSAISEFQELANQELSKAGLEESLRLLDESQRLGQDHVADQALDRARRSMGEKLDADIEDFDPCLPNTEILRNDIQNLFQSLAKAMLLGVPGSSAGGARFDAAMAKIWRAVQRIDPNAAQALGEPAVEPPKCERTFTLDFNYSTYTAAPKLENQIFTNGSVEFGPDMTLDPPRLKGEGDLTVSGGGSAPCANWTNSGTKHVLVDGDEVTDESGNKVLRITLTYSGAIIVNKEFTCDPKGSIVEESSINEITPPFDIPMIDGHTMEWSLSTGMNTVENSLTLHVHESE